MCVSVCVRAAEESHLLLTQYSEPSEEGAFPFVARGSLPWLRSPGNVVVPHAGDPAGHTMHSHGPDSEILDFLRGGREQSQWRTEGKGWPSACMRGEGGGGWLCYPIALPPVPRNQSQEFKSNGGWRRKPVTTWDESCFKQTQILSSIFLFP